MILDLSFLETGKYIFDYQINFSSVTGFTTSSVRSNATIDRLRVINESCRHKQSVLCIVFDRTFNNELQRNRTGIAKMHRM